MAADFQGTSNSDTYSGSDLDELIVGGGGNDTLSGNGGNDDILGNGGDDSLTGGLGADTLRGGADSDELFGGEGNDLLMGDKGNDILNGGAGDDFLVGAAYDASGDRVLNRGGDEEFVFSSSQVGNDTIADFGVSGNGGNGSDVLTIDGLSYSTADDFYALVADLSNDNPTGTGNFDNFDGSASIEGDDLTLQFNNGQTILMRDVVGSGLEESALRDAGAARIFIVDKNEGDDPTQGRYDSIQEAVDGARAGDTIQINGGTYSESVVVDKALKFIGAGSETVTISDDGGNGAAFTLVGELGADEAVSFSGIGFQNSERYGILVGEDVVLGGLSVSNSHFEANDRVGIFVEGEGVSSVSITDSTFNDNGQPGTSSGDGSIAFFDFLGDITLANLTITGVAGENGIQINGPAGSTIGTVSLTDITIDGVFEKQPVAIQDYADLSGLSINGLTINADSTSFNTAINFDEIEGNFDLSDARFQNIVINTAGDVIAIQGDSSGSAEIDNRLTGSNSFGEFIRGYGGNDTLSGLGGDDTLIGGLGDDSIDGGDGEDAAVFSGDAEDYDIITDADGRATVSGADGSDVLINVERLEFADSVVAVDQPSGGGGTGGSGGSTGGDTGSGTVGQVFPGTDNDDNLVGTDEADTITAGGGNDNVLAGGGDDVVLGGAGNDTLAGGEGNDQVYGGAGNDQIAGGAGNDTLGGGEGDDQIFGADGDDVVYGGAGSDTLYGGEGNDLMYGGADDDILAGGNGDDEIGGGVGNDEIAAGDGADTVYGADGDDTIFAAGGADSVFGGSGDDVIYLGTNDGAQDVYSSTADNGSDVVYGFEDGTDLLNLTANGFTSFADLSGSIGEDADGNATIDLGNGDILTLNGVQQGDLDASDFQF